VSGVSEEKTMRAASPEIAGNFCSSRSLACCASEPGMLEAAAHEHAYRL
jgi:hypothetical protein